MFRILDRYLARQILLSTFFAVLMLSVVLVLGQMFRTLLNLMVSGLLNPQDVLKLVASTFPWTLSYTVPWGILTAVLLTFGRLSADNELISMRMAGMSLWRICVPVLIVAALASGLCFWINTSVAPRAYNEIKRSTHEAALRDPTRLFSGDQFVSNLNGFIIYSGKKDGDNLENVQVVAMQSPAQGSVAGAPPAVAELIAQRTETPGSLTQPARFIFSRSGKLDKSGVARRKELVLDLHDTFILGRSWPASLTKDERKSLSESDRDAYDAWMRDAQDGLPEVTLIRTMDSPNPVNLEKLFEKGARMRVGGMSMADLRTGIQNPATLAADGSSPPSHSSMLTEYNRRLSFSLACFVLALVGIPFGITAQRRETSVGFVLSLLVAVCYFAFIVVGGILQDSPEKYPHLWVWLPNLVFGALGIFLFLRLQRR